jgi:hypothetical protein
MIFVQVRPFQPTLVIIEYGLNYRHVDATALGNAGVALDEGAAYSSITADGKFTM